MRYINRIILSAILFLLTGLTSAQTVTRYYLNYDNFIRKIDVSPSKVVGKPFYRAVIEKRQVKQLDYILSDGSISSYTKYYYDRNGNLIVTDTYAPDSLLLSRESFLPDEIQSQMLQKIQGREWTSSQKDYFTLCTFDSSRNPIKYEVKAASGEHVGRLELRYNKRSDLVMEIWIRSRDNKVIELSEFTFDYAKSIQHIVQYDSSGLEVSNISLQLPVSVIDSTQQE
ncbi:MAG: hypothetical protein Q7J65_02425 [Candidatus Marinimicrobia bacterium]|nr:hypothetical protein [Candidatus Neomarinimicrobiota bacterium]